MPQNAIEKAGALDAPAIGSLRIVTLLKDAAFVADIPYSQAATIMKAFENRAQLTHEDRNSRETHAAVRIDIAKGLRLPDAVDRFSDVLGSAVLWLALKHWSNGENLVKGIEAQIADEKPVVLTVSIADPAPEGSMADTAWAFLVGERIHDGRDQLYQTRPERVSLIDNTNCKGSQQP